MAKGNKNIAEAGKQTRFSTENQPEIRGRKGKTVSEFLKEYGEGNRIEYEIKIYKDNSKRPTIQKGSIESETTINQLIATTIIKSAIQGNDKALNTYLERTEGKVAQNLNLGSQDDTIEPIKFKIINKK